VAAIRILRRPCSSRRSRWKVASHDGTSSADSGVQYDSLSDMVFFGVGDCLWSVSGWLCLHAPRSAGPPPSFTSRARPPSCAFQHAGCKTDRQPVLSGLASPAAGPCRIALLVCVCADFGFLNGRQLPPAVISFHSDVLTSGRWGCCMVKQTFRYVCFKSSICANVNRLC
jgi:hypothetical protein